MRHFIDAQDADAPKLPAGVKSGEILRREPPPDSVQAKRHLMPKRNVVLVVGRVVQIASLRTVASRQHRLRGKRDADCRERSAASGNRANADQP